MTELQSNFTTSWALSWAGDDMTQSGVVEGLKSFCVKCIKNIQYNLKKKWQTATETW